MNIEKLYGIYLQNPSISTDTRNIKKGDIFFALKGNNFDGNLFIKDALDAGATLCITDKQGSENDKVLNVENSLSTLQNLAHYHRRQFNIPFIAVTGSNGKTTTKELISAVLNKKYKTYTTKGNLNNHIGIPLTILRIKQDAEMAVIEMGANHLYEIESYCKIVEPTHGLITNCGSAHLEGFGSAENIRKGKGELFDYLALNNGTAFINKNYSYLEEMSIAVKTRIFYGKGTNVDGHVLESDLLFVKLNSGEIIKSHLVGNYNLNNIISAVAAGKHFNVGNAEIISAIENYIPSNNRSQLILKGSNKIILDAYNANPSSMAAAIENFAASSATHKGLILGGMKEMGSEENKEHENLISLIKKYNWDFVVLVGKEFENHMPEALHFENAEDVKVWFSKQNFNGYSILIKGSRSNKLEKIIE